MVAVGSGTAMISMPLSQDQMEVEVTDLITTPTYSHTKKTVIPCDFYTESEANILDDYLEYLVNLAGLKTRAGVIAAARFLTLQLKYRIPYFYENGRLDQSGVNYVDGEGRYYHQGLYLSENKKSSIVAKFSGPSIWGCPLTNWEDAKFYGFYEGQKKPNGLDCSGFIAWVLKNGGFDPGDIGAGESSYTHEMTDLGEFVRINESSKNKVKVGDLISYDGHIAIIIGIDKSNYYVAESLPNLGGAVAKLYNKDEITDTFDYFVLMDKYYETDGNLTNMW